MPAEMVQRFESEARSEEVGDFAAAAGREGLDSAIDSSGSTVLTLQDGVRRGRRGYYGMYMCGQGTVNRQEKMMMVPRCFSSIATDVDDADVHRAQHGVR